MNRKGFCLASLVVASWTCGSLIASAQDPQPLSRIGGNAGREMRAIYQEAIGTGYDVGSLNRQSLNRANVRVPNLGQLSTRSGPSARVSTGLSGYGNASKPFSNYSPAPTVSPYLNLFREDLDGSSDLNYNTLVKPMLQQQQLNAQLERQNFEINSRLQSIAAQSDFNPSGSTSQPPTGHQTVFMYYGHFYPQPGRRR